MCDVVISFNKKRNLFFHRPKVSSVRHIQGHKQQRDTGQKVKRSIANLELVDARMARGFGRFTEGDGLH